jgi:hypothetical protein
MTVIDNGIGMDEEVLVSAMLTMSGSKKGENSVGGFGSAKNLILFAHESYTLHTRDNFVDGRCLSYNLTKSDYLSGTKIEIVFHETFNYDKIEFQDILESYLAKCNFRNVTIKINNAVIELPRQDLELCQSTDWCNVYSEEKDYETHYANVRKNGICMFNIWLSQPNRRHFTIELALDSTECMSANRDTLKYTYQNKLQEITNNILINRNSFGKLYNSSIVYRGKVSFSFIDSLRHRIDRFIEDLSVDVIGEVKILVDSLTKSKTVKEQSIILDKIQQIAPEIINIATDLNSDFIIDISKKGVDDVPKNLVPGTMSKKYSTYAKLWKSCVSKVIEIMGEDVAFQVGWIISESDTLAMLKTINGGYCFQVNPYELYDADKKKMTYNMLMAACHEYSHIYHRGHNEDFSSMYYTVTTKVLSEISSWREIYNLKDNIEL